MPQVAFFLLLFFLFFFFCTNKYSFARKYFVRSLIFFWLVKGNPITFDLLSFSFSVCEIIIFFFFCFLLNFSFIEKHFNLKFYLIYLNSFSRYYTDNFRFVFFLTLFIFLIFFSFLFILVSVIYLSMLQAITQLPCTMNIAAVQICNDHTVIK